MGDFALNQITPFIPCRDLARQIRFYRDILGFTLGFRADNYAFMRQEAIAVRLIEVAPGADLSDKETSLYIDVRGIDALYDSLKPKLSCLPEGRVRSPFDQEYGQREFHVIDEDCTLLFFGEAIRG